MSKSLLITIDGPAGSGKSTAAKYLAERLGFIYLDTGAMYRGVTYAALKNNVADDKDSVIDLVKKIDIRLDFVKGTTRVFLDDEEVTEQIRTPEVSAMVSEISRIGEVREELVKKQREIGAQGGMVAEGRDTTTVVFPDADIKIYLTASLESRVDRRYKEFIANGQNISREEVKANIEKRDVIDSGRSISPLKKADDAIEIDNTSTPIDKEIENILKIIEEKGTEKQSHLKSQ
ncbi:(d)CMP kinase [Bacteroidota bacterium]